MNKHYLPSTLLCDFYKVSHKNLYPKGTEVIYSTWTPRSSKHGGNVKSVVAFGFQGFIKKYLIDYFNDNFFNRPKKDVIDEYARIIKYTLGVEKPDTSHIAELHDLGYLPILIKSVKEGTLVPIKVPMLTIENTNPKFFWLTNYLETLLSTELWQASTSATKAYEFRKLLDEYALKTVGNTDFVDFQAHDFSMRGMSSLESAQISGASHLLSFTGTDTIPSILYLENYYNANVENELVGASVVATEHSIQSSLTPSNGNRDEYEAYKYLITEACTEGIMSIVSDTYDLWKVVEDVLPRLKNEIISRDGKIVIRPDSGLPQDIICGNPNGNTELERIGLVEALFNLFGGNINDKGYKELDEHIGVIYGDSINPNNAKEILERLEKKGFASSNVTLGLGSYFYQYNTRDTFGFAMKATYAVVNGEERFLLKDPKTDDGTKKSLTGRVHVGMSNGELKATDNLGAGVYVRTPDLLEDVFVDGKLIREQTLVEIREILKG